jgi:hypothetical protein
MCAGVFDLTAAYDCPEDRFTLDAYVWEDADGLPGSVLAVVTGFDPYPIGLWPTITRHSVPMIVPVSGSFWVGEWGNWPGHPGTCTWFMAVDQDGNEPGCPFTYIAPGLGWPSGWQHADVVWGQGSTKALGIGYWGHSTAPTSGMAEPEVRGRLASWGEVKSLYR